MVKEIGGYFGLELAKKNEYHSSLLKLNSCRNAFKYILKVKKPKKVFIPNFICNSVVEPLIELNINYEFYNINNYFEITLLPYLKEKELILYVNYFALKAKYIKFLVKKYGYNLIIDNSQAFFEKPINNIDTIYSPRKFFGVSDGGYLSTKNFLNQVLKQDESYQNTIQLLGRIDKDASSFYEFYRKAEERLINQPIKEMSCLTKSILSSINYKNVIKQRKINFKFLHQNLKNLNQIKIKEIDFIPFVYPLMLKNIELREKLIKNKIYVAKYWAEVLERENISNIEKLLVNNIFPLPCDQRYNLSHMKRIVEVIKNN